MGVNVAEDEVVAQVKAVDAAPVVEKEEAQPNLFEAKKDEGAAHTQTFDNQSDAPACDTCGSIMVRNAACYKCLNCGATSGCS